MSRFPSAALAAALLLMALVPAAAAAVDPGGTAEPEAPAPAESAAFDAGAFDLDGIGRAPTEAEIAGWDIDIRPDGAGLPEGRGTVAEGEELFVVYCSSCHGDFGESAGRWPPLAGGIGTLASEDPVKTVGSYWPHATTLLDYTYRAMPFGYGQSLSPDELYAISAYVLYLNDVILDEAFELSPETLAGIEMPNADGFVPDDRETVEAHFWDEPCMTDCAEGAAEITMRAAVLDVTPDGDGGEDAPTLD